MPEPATLRIYRPERSAKLFVIEMDGRELTRLRNGRNWAGLVEPGRHILRVTGWWPQCPPLELVLAPGDDVRLDVRIRRLKDGFWASGTPLLVRTDAATTGPPVVASAPLPAVQVLGVTETHRSEEPIGTDPPRRIGDASGVGRVTRTIRVTKEWSRMVSLDLHARDADADGITVGPNWLALKRSIEQSLERTFAISAGRREEFAEEIGVEIEPGADVSVILAWKRIWQHGFARVVTEGGEVNVPFRLVVGVTFDQSIR